jgi:hypothetical protein
MSPDASSPGARSRKSAITRTGAVTVDDCARRVVAQELEVSEPSLRA